ncbi:hypothetical protein PAXINDRAFT_117775 [Paxillus involutus ATCC 200175]|jgi:hypothetical protein|uniref:G-patch domain-containing protein n=1 Tax=Paxillus involutus ATCC 200175 TaxID=664439 RepID=A0A0C9TZT6_PAXIN|nr:hypothetical protein PAXINDRAFT_117775 [Paxillus involutus ATCC 200175]
MEEGEIAVPGSSSSGMTYYDYAYEWPGDSDISSREVPDRSALWPPLRLRVLQSSILHKNLNLAVLDAYGEAQFGRDLAPAGSETPRIRLKEMEVSKLHATAFWDKERREWAVVDMGSKHGTFLQSARQPDAEPIRLSLPRVAGIPRPLRHLDRLIIGSTTFLCHIHDDRIPCAECTSIGQGDIPLFAVPKDGNRTAEKRPSDAAGIQPMQTDTRNPKKALTTLKRALLSRLDRHDQTPPSTPTQPTPTYINRSARRRAMHPGSQFDSPGVQSPRGSSPGRVNSSSESSQAPSSAVIEQPRTPGPLSQDNVGWRLLTQQGWRPGTSLGSISGDKEASGLIEPIEVSPTAHRAGLGMHQRPATAGLPLQDWKENSKERRWESIRASGIDREDEG